MHDPYDTARKAFKNPRTRQRVLATTMRCLVGAALKVTIEHLLGWW